MFQNKLFRISGICFLAFAIVTGLFVSCSKDESDNNSGPSSDVTITLTGLVVDDLNMPLTGVTLKAGNSTTTTNGFGVYILENVKLSNGRYYISAEYPGCFEGGRGGLAKAGEHYTANIVLLKKGPINVVDGSTGGSIVTNNNGSLIFPADAFETSDGQPYTGFVKVYSKHLSPDAANFSIVVPGGDLISENSNGELNPLTSYGMMGVELLDLADNPLKIASGKTVTIRFPVAASQLTTAPSTIPLLSFDNDKGVWIEEGIATRNGNFYEGIVSHFTWWNCDDITNPPAPTIVGTVIDCNNTPMPGITVTVDNQMTIVTDAQGQYSNWIPPGTHTFQVLSSNNPIPLNSPVVTFTVVAGSNTIPALVVPCPAYVSVQAVDCNSNNIPAYGFAIWNGGSCNIQFSSTGSLQFYAPPNQNVTVQIFNGQSVSSTTLMSGNLNTITSAGNLSLCNTNAGACVGGPTSVTDIDGNVYNVVTIGNQCWMQENLKTTKYRNGLNIPLIVNDSLWATDTIGAQTDKDKIPGNSDVYGKLYNWFAVANPAGLCPVGWHVANEADWNQLVSFLDPSADTNCANCIQSSTAGGQLKSTGVWEMGTGFWQTPNGNATNSSGFTALPGGGHEAIGFISPPLHQVGIWWSASNDSIYIGRDRGLNFNDGSIVKYDRWKNDGASVRCVRD